MTPLRVLIADDHPLFREGVAALLGSHAATDVVGQAETGRRALEMTRELSPDLVLLDLSMPDGGLWALGQIKCLDTPPVVAMLTVSEEDDDVFTALKSGADGYILKGIGGRDLIAAIEDLAAGRSYVSPGLAMKVLQAMRNPSSEEPKEDLLNSLTAREEEILRLVATGKSNKEVGRALDLQEKTVKHYMTIILQKLQVRNRTEAALMAHGRWPEG
ncbi:response regulator [Aliiruegeria lutimaris]|uniref:Two component transcriptional regulator, LuxR family n=1 Tax=Aliiruegeria lutimaris TaxID=571298 RepID=A0A1G8YJZ7_9RHOB|nr:response regulator transcription factor [Aliiruegeria lutimaris]SDK02505.1 two component transcriptional regulator, LuxR family [Aliiruegeria lutimaris]